MFASKPSGARSKTFEMWRAMRTFSLEFLQYWWDVVEEEGTPESDAIFEQWTTESTQFEGLRTTNSQKHGPVRAVSSNEILEQSYKAGKQHGISRRIDRSDVWIEIWKEGEF